VTIYKIILVYYLKLKKSHITH